MAETERERIARIIDPVAFVPYQDGDPFVAQIVDQDRADALRAADAILALRGEEVERQCDSRYPFVYHDRNTWGRVGVSLSEGDDFIVIDTMLENKPGARWKRVELKPDEAEQLGLRLLERVNAYRAALSKASGHE